MTLRDNLEDVAFEPGLGIRSFARRSFAHFAQIKSATNLAFSLFYVRFKKKIEKISQSLIFAHFLFFDEQCE